MARYLVEIERQGKRFEVEIDSTGGFEPQTEEKDAKAREPFLQRVVGKKAYKLLSIPQEKAKAGLGMLSEKVPSPTVTGNLPLDILKGTPRVAAETLAEAAPAFVSPESLATAGALRSAKAAGPIVKPMLRYAGKQAESFSNVAEGALERAYNNASLIFSKGKKAAGKIYKSAKSVGGPVDELTDEILTHKEIVEKAEKLANDKKLSAAAAQIARHSLDALFKSKQYGKDAILKKRSFFDAAVKKNKKLSNADRIYRDAVSAESLRNLFPQNKLGGASPFRMAVAQAFALLPGGQYLKYGALPLTSPLAQGLAATGAGIAGRRFISPLANVPTRQALSASAVLQKIRELRNNK